MQAFTATSALVQPNPGHVLPTDPPQLNFFSQTAQSHSGRIVGSYSCKAIAGSLVGVGMMLNPATGIGLALVLAGTGLWAGSSILSTAALEDHDAQSILLHLSGALVSGGAGVGGGAFGVVASGIAGPLGFMAPVLTPIFGAAAADIRLNSQRAEQNPDTEIELTDDEELDRNQVMNFHARDEISPTEPATAQERDAILDKLKNLFSDGDDTINVQRHNGRLMETLTLHIEPAMYEGNPTGLDFITATSLGESKEEWIAMRRSADSLHYDLLQRNTVYDDTGAFKFQNHPLCPGTPMTEVEIIAGPTLLDLLNN